MSKNNEIFECQFKISADYNVKENAFTEYGDLILEGNIERIGMLIRHCAKDESSLKRMIDIAAGVIEPNSHTEIRRPKRMNDNPSEMSDEEIKDMIRRNHNGMNRND